MRFIRPALPAERGRLDRLGCGLPLHLLDRCDVLAVPLTVQRGLRPHAVGTCAAKRLDDEATTSGGSRFGLALGGGLPAVRRGQAMARPPVRRVSPCHLSEY